MRNLLTDVDGVLVGHAHDPRLGSGATAIVFETPAVTSVEYMPWLYPLFTAPPALEQGRLVPPPGPGLGLELDPEAVRKYRVAF